MSDVRLVVRDAAGEIHGTCHGATTDRLIAALTAEPETISELARALDRFEKCHGSSPFASFARGMCEEPYDAGIVIIDLAARLVAVDSTYSSPDHEGYVDFHDGHCAAQREHYYELSDDWAFAFDLLTFPALADQRRAERAAQPPLDVRAVLYGPPLLEFVARECFSAFCRSEELSEEQTCEAVKEIHIRWLLTPREDLRDRSPREAMLAKRDFLSMDLQRRQEQWSFLGKCPPLIERDSHAYRYAGFGTHELVKYYDFVRELLYSCRDAAVAKRGQMMTVGDFLATEVERLAQVREAWLDWPDPEFHGRTARSIIESERIRKPEAATAREAMVDPDCPCCQAMADMPGLMFWGLDAAAWTTISRSTSGT